MKVKVDIDYTLLENILYAMEELTEEVRELRNWENAPYQNLVKCMKDLIETENYS